MVRRTYAKKEFSEQLEELFGTDELLNSNGLPVREDSLLNFKNKFSNFPIGSIHFLQQTCLSDWEKPYSRLPSDQ
jgi:hypothetical protein